jgi:hypothetical protein
MARRRTVTDEARYLRDRARRLYDAYGITLEEYDAIKEKQGGVCYICRRAKGISTPLQVDHKHVPGYSRMTPQQKRRYVRGLVCGRDNNRLGWFEANAPFVLTYLEQWPAREVLK